VLADRDQLSEAETLAREAVSVIDQAQHIKSRGDARMSRAYVLRRAGRAQEAASVLREALELYERKGDVADAAIIGSRIIQEIEAAPESAGDRVAAFLRGIRLAMDAK